jgi:hypothetical protein
MKGLERISDLMVKDRLGVDEAPGESMGYAAGEQENTCPGVF